MTPTATYAVEPLLPSWLGLDTSTGIISNTTIPSSAYYGSHTITATGNGEYFGITTSRVIIAIAVNAINKTNLVSLVNGQISAQSKYVL